MDEVQGLLDQLVAAGAPGAAGWVEDERGSRRAASGLADLEGGRPMVPGLRFRAGSLTKSLVATVVLRLVAEGRLSLSDTVEQRLPGILAYGDRVTVRQLLNHTGGVPDYWAAVERTLYGSREGLLRVWTPEELVALVADQPQAFRAGSAWSYSNTGYILLGLVVEAVTGRALAEELDRGIFRPLGLRDSLLPGDDSGIPPPGSSGYSLPLGPPGQVPDGPLLDFTAFDPSPYWAAGGLMSTLGDLTRFFRALLGGRLLPPRLLTEMLPAVTVPSRSLPLPLYDQYGLGLLEVETPAGRLVGNAGGIPGFLSIILGTRDGRRQLGVMINVLLAPDPVYEAFIRGFRALGVRLLSEERP